MSKSTKASLEPIKCSSFRDESHHSIKLTEFAIFQLLLFPIGIVLSTLIPIGMVLSTLIPAPVAVAVRQE